jgi:hypothetical protein
MNSDDVAETAKGLRAVLDEIEAGNLVCHPATRHRIEGALLALEQLTGGAGPPESRLSNDRFRTSMSTAELIRAAGVPGDATIKDFFLCSDRPALRPSQTRL